MAEELTTVGDLVQLIQDALDEDRSTTTWDQRARKALENAPHLTVGWTDRWAQIVEQRDKLYDLVRQTCWLSPTSKNAQSAKIRADRIMGPNAPEDQDDWGDDEPFRRMDGGPNASEDPHAWVDREGTEMETTPTECVFCQIVAGEAPATVIRRWPGVITILPRGGGCTPGHVLVIPTVHVADVAANPAVSALTMAAAAELAGEHPACNVITSKGAEATQTVFHLHIHVVPRHAGDGLALPWTGERQ